MRTLTKEWLLKTIAELEEERDATPGAVNEDATNALAAMKLALASLEAKPLGYIDAEYAEILKSGHVESCSVYAESGEGCFPVYTAPPAPLEIADLHRKAAIHDALCEKYKVESLTDFVAWQRNHIAELEAVPPAPVGEGEAAVMPDYPGYVMTQRECFLAGKRAGMAGAGNSPVIPDGWVMVPKEPTSEMQSAAACAIRFDTTPINKLWTGNAVYKAMLAAAPQQEV